MKTAAARALIGNHVPLPKTIQQTANLGAFVHALHTADYSLWAASEDHIAEPHHKQLILILIHLKLWLEAEQRLWYFRG